ncbi:MAG: TrmB family transcriptional regulator [Candidatus Thermoplasmatota archaeon]|jgi:sugar-specific transcriptional regulator TrmB|nr:TrmB family transcriptional regulator [Candidatus Thermoplasmatota archaeon]MCL5790345.1 TrmB family transcriptional regulator [Candidatus Thermoplasmatota archaeon]
MEEDIFEGLSKFGLSSYEIKIYESLVLKGPMSSTEIVKSTGVPQPRVYDLFTSLSNKGFIEQSLGKKTLYKAIPISTIMRRQREWLESYSTNLERYVQKRMMYSENYKSFLSVVEKDEKITEKIINMISETSTELILSVKYERLASIIDELRKALERGITVLLLVYVISQKEIKTLSFDGKVLLRFSPGKGNEMTISDRKSCLVTVQGDEGSKDYGIYLEEDDLIHVMSYYFNQSLWHEGKILRNFDPSIAWEFCNVWVTCDAIDCFSKAGYSVEATVEGFFHEDRRHIKGMVERTERIPFVRNTFYVKTEDEKIYSVGGKTASLEDIKMTSVKLRPFKA